MKRAQYLALAAVALPIVALVAPVEATTGATGSDGPATEGPTDLLLPGPARLSSRPAAVFDPPDPLPPGSVRLVDDTGWISIVVPGSWNDFDTAPDTRQGSETPWISATPDQVSFFPAAGEPETFSVPGALYRAFALDPDPAVWLEGSSYHDICDSEQVQPFANLDFSGSYQWFGDCNGTGTSIVQVAATRWDNAISVLLFVQLVGDPDDRETVELLFGTMS